MELKPQKDILPICWNRIVLLVLLLCCTSVSFVSGQSILFDHLRTEDGLSQYSVQAIYQDELNRVWIATKDGLNLYDGKNIQVFRPIPGDTTSIYGNNVQNVTGNGKGEVYIHCMIGLIIYDLRLKKMRTVATSNVGRIAMGNNRLWISHENSLSYLDNKTKKLVPYHLFDPGISITCISEMSEGTLYIGTREHGLIILDKNHKTEMLLPSTNVICIYEDAKKNQWVGTLRNGLYCIDRNHKITNFRHDPFNKNSLSNDFVRVVNQDNLGNLWIGTFNGLNQFNVSEQRFIHYFHSEQKRHSIGSNSIWSLLKDVQGTMWVGSFYGGLDRFNPEYSFNFYYTADGDKTGLCGGIVGSIAEDSGGNLWICSENSGLNYFDRKKNEFTYYLNDEKGANILSKGSLKDIYYDEKENSIWIGTHLSGLLRLNIKNKQVSRINHTANSLGNDYVRRILPFEDKLILGTHNSVYLFDKKAGVSKPLLDNDKYKLNDKQIWDMFIDSQNRLWFSTSSSVYCYQMTTGKLQVYNHNMQDSSSLQPGNLYTFMEDKTHRIWIGSAGGGLSLFDEQTRKFKRFNTQNSQIIDDYVVDIAQTPMGYILIATDRGVSRFDFENQQFYNYYNYDIFPFSALKEQSLFVTRSGELAIGSVNGMVIVNERDLDLKVKEYTINFTQLYINNVLVKPNDKTSILEKAIEFTDTIELGHQYNVFRIDYATTNFIKAAHPTIYYKLEGFDEDWISASPQDNITYTNLKPGKYKLLIKAESEQSGPFSVQKELFIIVNPPFYNTFLAYFIYVILLVVITYMLIRNYTSRIKLKSSLQFAERERNHVEELNQLKLQFFTNISHELRTPVTLIISQLESIIETNNLQANISQKVFNVLRNTDKMRRLIDELLDFSKQEREYLHLKISEQDIVKFINESYLPFREYAVTKEIHISFEASPQSINVWFDPVQFEKVIYNLLSNAFKFTKPGDSIIIKVVGKDEMVIIQVSDTGCGIMPEAIDKIFNRFYQEDKQFNNSGTGTGIGLALSKNIVEAHGGSISVESVVNEGTTFSVALHLGSTHFDPEKTQKIDYEKPDRITYIEPLAEQDKNEIMAVQENHKTYSILIVDDNSEILDALANLFESFYHVHQAKDAVEGLKLVESIQPDLVISDVMMPMIDGIEFCKRIKSNLNTCHIPVILLTARVAVEHIIFGLNNGADDYIIKPFNSKLLLVRCNNIINNRKSLQTFYRKNPTSDTKMIATNALDQELLEKAVKIVEKHLQNTEFDVNMFATEMCLGRTNLFRKIKGITGQTPNEFILNIRLKKSLFLLASEPHVPIFQIAMMVGFKEDSYYMRCFKKNFGKTPSQYRDEQQST